MLLHEVIKEFEYYLKISNKSNETITGYSKDINAFEKFVEEKYNGPVYIEEIKVLDIEDYLHSLKLRKLQNSSISRNLYTIRSFWNFAYKNRFAKENIASFVETIKVKRKEREYLTEEEVKELVHNIDHKLISLVVETLFYSGMRISECINLKVNDVDFDDKVIRVINGKGGKDRNIPINKDIINKLKYYKDHERPNKSDYFFCTEKSGRLSAPYINRIINDTVINLGWSKHVSAHILRHSFASCLIKKGVNLVHVQKLLGHSNLKVTSIYTHTNLDELAQSIDKL